MALAAVILSTTSRADARAADADTVAASDTSQKAAQFHPGDSVVLALRDGSRVAGVFVDLGRDSLEAYRARYDSWRRTSGEAAALPELETPVEFVKPGSGARGGDASLFWLEP
jgi:hypothetical protein